MDPANGAQVSGSFITPLSISLAGIAVTSLALIAYHFLLVKYCLRQGDHQGDDEATTGVEHKVLETIPILSFSMNTVKELGTDHPTECVVCLGELMEGETVRLLPNCKHLFHVQCIDNWFSAHSSCPICRTLVTVSSYIGGDQRAQSMRQDGAGDQAGPSNSGVQSNTLLRHCVSLVLPREHIFTGLKRSLSMNQCHVYINIIDESGEASSSSTSKMILKNCYEGQSMRHLDRMSSLLRSLRVGRSSTSYGILP